MASITPHYRSIQELLQSKSYSIDEYQREYKWDTRNIDELLSDLVAKFLGSYREGDEPAAAASYDEYFLGSIIVTKRGERRFLVDGQQRTTSLTLLLIHLYRLAKSESLGVASMLEPLIYSNNYGQMKFNLDIEERLDVLRALFDGQEYNTDGKPESNRTIAQRFADIEHFDLQDELGAGLEIFIYWFLNRVGLIEIETESDLHAYSIFETMNDRGKPLSPVDMMKAYLLGAIHDGDDRARANDTWKRTVYDLTSWGGETDLERDASMIKAWLRAQYAESTRERKSGAIDKDWEKIGTTFHRWVREEAKRIGADSAAGNLRLITEEFAFFARAYAVVMDATQSLTPGLESVFYNAHNDFTWQSTVLLAALDPRDDDETVRRKLSAVATYLDIWLMRRVVNYIRVGYSSVSYTMFLLARDIRRLPLAELVPLLKQKLLSDDVTMAGAATRERYGVVDLRLNQFSRRYIMHFLARVTAYVEERSGKLDQFPHYIDRRSKNPFDIEHIVPRDLGASGLNFESEEAFVGWRDRIGGLLLLPADVNRSLQAKPYRDKVGHYAKQNMLAASLTAAAYEHQPRFSSFIRDEGLAFTPYEKFGTDEQAARGELMLALAERIWSPDRIR